MQKSGINYQQIFMDILESKFPQQKTRYQAVLQKPDLSAIEIITLNEQIFGHITEYQEENQKHRSYSPSDITKILEYQKKNRLNNSEVALHFKLSRNTIAKWKKIFLV